jgi:hypothetical protein
MFNGLRAHARNPLYRGTLLTLLLASRSGPMGRGGCISGALAPRPSSPPFREHREYWMGGIGRGYLNSVSQ